MDRPGSDRRTSAGRAPSTGLRSQTSDNHWPDDNRRIAPGCGAQLATTETSRSNRGVIWRFTSGSSIVSS
jgi:hypothetical protein